MTFRFSDRGGRGVLPLLLILISILAIPSWAAGDGDNTFDTKAEFAEVARLIEDRRYNDAIELLVEIGKRDPEQMEKIQKRILDIQEEKDGLNGLFALLPDAISRSDSAEAARIITEIKTRFPYLNRKDKNRLILALSAVSKVEDDNTRDGFFDEGNALLAAGEYREAVRAYRRGFISNEYLEIYDDLVSFAAIREPLEKYIDDPERQELIWNAYGTIAPEGDVQIGELLAALDIWDADALELPGITGAVRTVLDASAPGDWTAETGALVRALSGLESDIAESRIRTQELDVIKARLYEAMENAPEEFRYERIGQFMSGRPGREGQEGILLAQELLWESAYIETAARMIEVIENDITRGRTGYGSGNWDEASGLFASASLAAESYLDFSTVADNVLISQEERGDERLASATAELAAYGAYAAAAAPLWSELVELRRDLPRIGDLDFNDIAISRIDELADPIQSSIDRTEELQSLWNTTESGLSSLPGSTGPDVVNLDTSLRADLNQTVIDFRAQRLSLYVNAIIPLYENLERESRDAMTLDLPATRLFANGADDVVGELPERHPSSALDNRITPALAVLKTAGSDIGDFLDVLGEMLERQPPIANPEQVIEYRSKAENLLLDVSAFSDSLEDLEQEALKLASAARRAETTAANALDAAGRDLASAQAAINRGQSTNDIDEFYRAIDLYSAVDGTLDRVDELYLQVRVNDIDIATDSGIDTARTDLRNRVQNDRGRVAVTVKQNAIEEGRTSYDDGRYAYGVGILTQSQEFWNRAYGEDDTELAGWLLRLRNAQQALLYTVIEASDPLYSEMNQYLNLANRYFENGVRIARENPRNADAMLAFRASEDLLAQVLNTFPGNEAALLLEQKILRQTDADAWTAQARDVMNLARRAVTRNDLDALRGDEKEKGLDPQVQVLEQIEPDFPGLKDLLYDVDVALGRIIPPPDPADIRRSQESTATARQIWENLGLNGSDNALALLNTALELWLENTEASNLKNEILLSAEPESLPPIPAELLNILAFFDQYYDESNFIVAKTLLDRAVADYPAFADDPRIQERRKKIEARL